MVAAEAVVLFFFLPTIVKSTINPHGPTVISDFANCINNLVNNNFKEPGVLIFANFNNASTPLFKIKAKLLNKIHNQVKYSIEVKSPQNEVDICYNYDDKFGILHRNNFEARLLGGYFVIIIDSYEEFPYLVSRLIRSAGSWNPNAKFIILLFNFAADHTNKRYVENILSCFFKYNVINIAVVVPQENNVRNAIVYSWRPYDPPKYCGYFNETARDRLLIENRCEKGLLKYKRHLYKHTIPMDMSGCVLYIIALERQPFVSRDENDPSIEEILIDELVKRYKLTTKYEILNAFRGERDEGQWNGALSELIKKKGQLLLGGIFPDYDVHEDFETSNTYLADSYTWVVPRAHHSPPWVALVIIFHSFVWYSVIAAFFVSALFWRILGQLSRDAPFNKSLNHCFLNTWICCLGFCGYLRPNKPSLRVFFVFFNIYCIMVITGYQTKLIDVLTNPTFEYQIHTTEELVESGLKFGGFEELHDIFSNSSDPFDIFLYENWIDVEDVSIAMVDVAHHRNFSLLCSRLELAHLSAIHPDLSDSLGNYKYFAFDTSSFSVPMEMVAIRGFSLMEKISETLALFKQAGINVWVRQHFRAFNTRRRAKLLRSLLQEKSDIGSLSLQHLQGGFLILALGYASGTFVLVLEIVLNTEFIRRKFNSRNSF